MNFNPNKWFEQFFFQVEAYCKGKNLVIAGYYQANENYNDNE